MRNQCTYLKVELSQFETIELVQDELILWPVLRYGRTIYRLNCKLKPWKPVRLTFSAISSWYYQQYLNYTNNIEIEPELTDLFSFEN